MGLFDTFTGNLSLQLKAGDPGLMNYKVGDEVEIPDGVYVASGYDGIVVIHQGKLIATHHSLLTTFGTTIKPDFIEGTTEEERALIRDYREMGDDETKCRLLVSRIERRRADTQKDYEDFETRLQALRVQHPSVSEVKEELKAESEHHCHCHTGCGCPEDVTGKCEHEKETQTPQNDDEASDRSYREEKEKK